MQVLPIRPSRAAVRTTTHGVNAATHRVYELGRDLKAIYGSITAFNLLARRSRKRQPT